MSCSVQLFTAAENLRLHRLTATRASRLNNKLILSPAVTTERPGDGHIADEEQSYSSEAVDVLLRFITALAQQRAREDHRNANETHPPEADGTGSAG